MSISCSDHSPIGFLFVGTIYSLWAVILNFYFFEDVSQTWRVCRFGTCTVGVFCVMSAMNLHHFCDFACIYGSIFDGRYSIWCTFCFRRLRTVAWDSDL